MTPPSLRLAPRLAIAVSLLAAAIASCADPTRPDGDVRAVSILLPDTILRPGRAMRADVEVLDIGGRPLQGRSVTWRSLTPATLGVDQFGNVIALAPGEGRLRATVGSVFSTVRIALVNPPVASLSTATDTARLVLPVGSLQVAFDARDSAGAPIIAPAVWWETGASRIASVSADGRITAVASGMTEIVVRAIGVADTLIAQVGPPSSPDAPVILNAVPQDLAPGETVVLNGTAFAPTLAGNSVLVDGIPVAVVAASPTRLTLSLPQTATFACRATGVAAVQVSTAGGIGVTNVNLRVAPQRALAIGEAFVPTTAEEARCLELAPSEGRYLITVQNVARQLGSIPIAATLGGSASSLSGPTTLVDEGSSLRRAPAMFEAGAWIRENAARHRTRHRAVAHERVLRANAMTFTTSTAATVATVELRPRSASATPPPLGTILPVRIPNIDSHDQCAIFIPIGARTVFVGPHVMILEDTQSTIGGVPTLRGQMDAEINHLGEEFERVVWPLLARFGDPLAMDARLDANGRAIIVLTPRLNAMFGGAALGLTVLCDLFSRAQEPSSNVGEYLYAQVPLNRNLGAGSVIRWRAEIRATIAHEMKHIVSNAERLARGLPLEEPWLDEATARVAEELFARAIYGTTQRGEHGFDATLSCEIFLGAPGAQCADAPRALLPHMEGIYEQLNAPTARSTLGATAPGDLSHYGSAWSLVRWAADQDIRPEADFLRALTIAPQSGLANLEARVGRPWERFLGEWTLAIAQDGRRATVPVDPRLRFPSWDLTAVFLGLCNAIGACGTPQRGPLFARAHPLAIPEHAVGGLAIEFPAIVPGGFAAVELVGGANELRQLLHLRGYRGAPVPATLRLAILRIE